MLASDRDQSLVRFCAETVMGWRPRIHPGGVILLYWDDKDQRYIFGSHWNPLDSWADAGMLWEKAREKGTEVELIGRIEPFSKPWDVTAANSEEDIFTGFAHFGSRAITEVIARAFGWKPEGESL